MIKLDNLKQWRTVKPGDGVLMPGIKRRIRIAFMTSKDTAITVLDGDAIYPVGSVKGFASYEFGVQGDIEIHFDSTLPVMWRSDDGDQTATQPSTDAFTKMMERKARNPEMEHMMYMAEQNAQRRMEAMLASAEATIERRMRDENGTAAARGTPQPKPVASDGAGATGDGSGGTTPAGNAGTDGAGGHAPSAAADAGAKLPKQPETSGAAV